MPVRARVLAWLLLTVATVSGTGAIALSILTNASVRGGLSGHASTLGDATNLLGLLLAGLAGAVVVARRPETRMGWLFLAMAASAGVTLLANNAGVYGIVARPGAVPGAIWLAWVGQWAWLLSFGPLLTFVPLLFPDGRLPSARWRGFAWGMGLWLLAVLVATAINPVTYNYPKVANPAGLGAWGFVIRPFVLSSYPAVAVVTLICAGSVVLRYRRAEGDERLQIKWFAFGAAFMAGMFVIGGLCSAVGQAAASDVFSTIGFLGVPLGAGIAILKYRLYDIDVVINRTVVFGLLAGFITAVYVAIVVGLGALIGQGTSKPNLGLSILATAVVAVAFQPVRDRVQKLANRLVYGKRATPYEVLSEFSSRMAGSYATEDLLPRMARILAEGTGAAEARVWLKVGPQLKAEAAWPAELPPVDLPMPDGHVPDIDGASLVLPVDHRAELLGALSLTKRSGERLTPAEEHLARDLASGAGLVLRNVRLTEELLSRLEELQASRQRIVAAQDSERRRLERNIHDGAQQQLVALAVKVRLARSLADRDPLKASEVLEQAEREVGDALEDLRDLARGIYPPLLADAGLVVALQSQVRRAPLPVEVQAAGVGRYSPEQEAAAYFCVLEAMQNVGKYAAASEATVRLAGTDGELTFEVSDDGVGFDVTETSYGTGLQGMADRLSALGGELLVRSTPGGGTTVEGRLPIHELERVG